jgi:chorismate synthase
MLLVGRVAAGAIAEKYLQTVHNIEIVAFVSSVGKIHLPSSVALSSTAQGDRDSDSDDAQDALSPEFVRLLKTVTREIVDQHPTRCPHSETAERMTKVNSQSHALSHTYTDPLIHPFL